MSVQRSHGVVLRVNKIMLTHDVGVVVLRHLATTQERVGVCRSVSKECRDIVDSGVRSLKANLQCLTNAANKLPFRFPKLQQLSFDRVSCGANDMLLQLARHQPHLLQKLKDLDLSNCPGLEADTLLELLKACSGLRKLSLPQLVHGVQSTGQEFVEVLRKYGAELTHLSGLGDYISSVSVHLLASLSNLQSLDMVTDNCLTSGPSSLQPLSSLTNLQHLQLGNSLACAETCALAASLPKLSSLQFAYVDSRVVTQQQLMPLTACRTLKHLTLCSVVCSHGLLSLLASCKVSSLKLSHLQLRVTDEYIAAFAAALPQLKALSSLSLSIHRACEDCSQLPPAIFGLPRLQRLSLASNYNGLKEQELVGLPTAAQLTSLSLRNHFSDATLCRILSAVPQLRELHLISCGSVGDEGLSCVVGHCKELRSVRLELMRGVGVAGVAAVAAGMHVTRVVVEGCRNVLAEECREVMRLLNKLDLEVMKLK